VNEFLYLAESHHLDGIHGLSTPMLSGLPALPFLEMALVLISYGASCAVLGQVYTYHSRQTKLYYRWVVKPLHYCFYSSPFYFGVISG
jgi:hypothetical protein